MKGLQQGKVFEGSVGRLAQPVVAEVKSLERGRPVEARVPDRIEAAPREPKLHEAGANALEVAVLDEFNLVFGQIQDGQMLEIQQLTFWNTPKKVSGKVELSQGTFDPSEGVGSKTVEFVAR